MISRLRHSFGKVNEIITPPGLVELQMQSYENFLQKKVSSDKREKIGLQAIFESIFPIFNTDKTVGLHFLRYEVDEPKFTPEECIQRDLTYESVLSGYFKLIQYEDDSRESIKFEKIQKIYLDNMPIMTDKGTFVINGTERVITSQMHRSPGVLFNSEKDSKKNITILEAKIIPYRGTWLSFRIDSYGIINVRIDSRRKIPVTTLLYAMGLSQSDILSYYYDIYKCRKGNDDNWIVSLKIDNFRGLVLKYDLIDANTKKILVEKNSVITGSIINNINELGVTEYILYSSQLEGFFIADDIVDETTGIIYVEAGAELNEINISKIMGMGINEISLLGINSVHGNSCIRDTLVSDKTTNKISAIMEIYSIIRPGENLSPDVAENMFNNMLFNPDYYDLSEVGRVKLNGRLNLSHDLSVRNLTKSDILETIKHLVEWKNTQVKGDDIDHLSNRRVRCVGELLENIYQSGILQTERVCKEKMRIFDVSGNALGLDNLGGNSDFIDLDSKDNIIDEVQIQSLINLRLVSSSLKDFLNSSQLSQFMDQTNPLSEVTHKRRVSALGPGGLMRERAGFEVRDVHPTHYGRICPIETPEGQNIGLINSLACYANINKYGFIETPYCEVVDGRVTDKIRYLTAEEEIRYIIAQAVEVNEDGSFKSDIIPCRRGLEFSTASPEEIDLIDISNKQSVSVSASLIPFLENDDANRALMGANMQRQAVPIINSQAPVVGTGMESVVAKESLSVVVAKEGGIVQDVDAKRIIIKHNDLSDDIQNIDVYNLLKFDCSNQNTCINQFPIVKKGQLISKNDVIADSFSSEKGELALGSNVLVAFMSWRGYNFEDSILISERLVKDDVFTSIHIEEFEIVARDTKLGEEEITRDIPSVSENALAYLDDSGIIKVGVNVKSGDILVGKVTPKGETQVSPVERLLFTFFNEKSPDVKDTSLRLPPGYSGRVIDVRVFNRHSVNKDKSLLDIEEANISQFEDNARAEKLIYSDMTKDHLLNLLNGKKLLFNFFDLNKDSVINKDDLYSINLDDLWSIQVDDKNVSKAILNIKKHYCKLIDKVDKNLKQQVEKEKQGFNLPPGVLKVIKVFIAVKRKIKVGDKMAGRHGNKGVISHILPESDMPFLEDGTPVDIILNPLGVPSRMNVGQIFETHLGWASYGLGKKVQEMLNNFSSNQEKSKQIKEFIKGIYSKKEYSLVEKMSAEEVIKLADDLKHGFPFATPVFDGAKEADINSTLQKADLDTSGQVTLYDGCTGDPFENKVTVGYIYMIKLHHLADEKMHARSIGTYSLINQQPLGGKSQFGGQRFGEMEVWALEAYGAAYTLQEMLTIKSDDVVGRTKIYNNIVTGDNNFRPGTPESFNVLVKQMQALCLNVRLTDEEDK